MPCAARASSPSVREGRLPLRGGAGRDRNLAVGQNAYTHALERAEPGALHVIGDPDAEIAPLRPRRPPPDAEVVVAGKRERTPLALRKVSACVNQRLAVA